MPIEIEPIAAFTDNYIWCLHDGKVAWVVDPGDAAPVIQFLEARQLRLDGVLITHHHKDHTGGILELQQRYSPAFTYGPANPAIAGIDHPLLEGDQITVLGTDFTVLEVPGHTLDHIAYFTPNSLPPLLFCGDTLFAAGCGRLLGGSAEQLYHSLQRLAQLPENTIIYCTHEYTQSNLRFARAVEPDNLAVQRRSETVSQLRTAQQPTLPSTLALELATNPFLRVQEPTVRAMALKQDTSCSTDVEVFAVLRRLKDHF